MLPAIAAALALLAAVPAGASAASVSTLVQNGQHMAVYRAAPGEANDLLVQVSTTSRLVRFTDKGAPIEPGAGCTALTPSQVDCRDANRVRLVQVLLGDQEDRAEAATPNTGAAQVNITGGDADDFLRGHGPSRFNFSGNGGDDHLIGSAGPDVLRGQIGNDYLAGRAGNDFMIGDEGRDTLRAGLGRDRLFGGRDGDHLDARDDPDEQDAVVSCGAGTDRANEDRVDTPKTVGCERILG